MHKIFRFFVPAALLALAACDIGPTEAAPREERILFSRYVGTLPQLFSIRPDGTDPVQITRTGVNECARWSPDGRKIALVGARDTTLANGTTGLTWELYVINADGSGERRLTTGAKPVTCVGWSPDGQRIVFAAAFQSVPSRPSLYIVNADGSNLTPLPAAVGVLPRWSPDGRTIVFSGQDAGAMQLRLISPDGTGLRTLPTQCTGGARQNAAWSPDGSRIAYECSIFSKIQVHVVNADGTGDITVPGAPSSTAADLRPTWSPDGQKLAISRQTDVLYKLFIVSADGSNPVQVTRGETEEVPSDWR